MHLLEVFAKTFYDAIMTHDLPDSYEFHACEARKNRLEPIIVQEVNKSRLKAQGLSAIRNVEDIANAVGSLTIEVLGENVPSLTTLQYETIARQRHDQSCFKIKCFDGQCCVLPGQGVLAGDPFAVKASRNCFKLPIAKYDELLNEKLKSNKMFSTRSANGMRVDGSNSIYGNDFAKVMIIGRQKGKKTAGRFKQQVEGGAECWGPI